MPKQDTKVEEARQLGISKATASSRLKKLLLFDFAKRLGLTECTRCKKALTADDFTIDHEKPWFNVTPRLFWDLKNVGFSHSSCNKRAARKNTEAQRVAKSGPNSRLWGKPSWKRKVGPTGTAWCRVHKDFLPVGRFTKDRKSWDGLAKVCRDCLPTYRKRWRNSHGQ
jgi:hypothetical protein